LSTSNRTNPATGQPAFDLTETDRLLTTTRAVRKRLDLDRPVEREVVLECLRVAIQAPSGSNLQRWRWLVVDDAEKKAGLAAIYRKSFEPYFELTKQLVASVGGDTDNPIIQSSEHLAQHLQEVPVLVIPCWLDRLPEHPSTADVAGLFGSIVPAVWNFMLALRSRGLGSTFTTLHLNGEEEAGRLLGIPDTVTQIALLPVAYTKGQTFKPAERRSIEEITYFNGWKQTA
jgi:nitroreductase